MKKRWKIQSYSLTFVLITLFLLAGNSVARADSFYDGKMLTIVVASSSTGGTSKWVRAWQPFFTEALGEDASVQVIFKPGGGSMLGGNYYARKVKHDGLTVLASTGSVVLPWILGNKQVQYDFREMTPIFASPVGGIIYTTPEFGKDPMALRNPSSPLFSAGKSVIGADLARVLAFDLLNLDVKFVFGYKSSGDQLKAFLTKEANLNGISSSGFRSKVQPEVDKGNAVPVFTLGVVTDEGKLVRDPIYNNLPSTRDVYKSYFGKEPSGEKWNAYKAITTATWSLQKMLWVFDDVPQAAKDSLINAFKKIVDKPEFKEAMAKRLGAYPQFIGKDAKAAFFKSADISPSTRAWTIKYLQEEWDVRDLE